MSNAQHDTANCPGGADCPYACQTAQPITRADWDRLSRHGYTSVTRGQCFALMLDRATGATVLQRVAVGAR